MGNQQRLRVAVVTESFLPTRNGVTTSVCRVLEHLAVRGHDAVVVCPRPAPQSFAGFPVLTVPSLSYRQFPVGLPSTQVMRTIAAFAPDVVHLASPFLIGARGVTVASQLGVPSVAVFQTDVPGFAIRHGAGFLAKPAWRWIRRLHGQADLTLAPSVATLTSLGAHSVPRLALWQRGVDGQRFSPARRGTEQVQRLRAQLAPRGEALVGYIGRLAPEKRVERLASLAGVPGIRLVIGGDGPGRRSAQRALSGLDPAFLGWLDGDDLADAYAALDVFVHTGTDETFGQTIQEAMASGLPVVAPARGGPLDLVSPGVNGLLYGPEDDAGLRLAVASLCSDDAQRSFMGAAARTSVEQRSWQALGDELIRHYQSVIAAAGRTVGSGPHSGSGASALRST
jgi:phosphatidylinositol alpha 1,6-mannosyltransferase